MDVTHCTPNRFYIARINGKYYRLKYLHDFEFEMYHKKKKVATFTLNKCFSYVFIPSATELAQENMESRALHMILRKITGDEAFSW